MTNDLAWMRPKLAELCGLEVWWDDEAEFWHDKGTIIWCPDEDIAQSIRCLESSKRSADIMFGGGNGELSWSCLLSNKRKRQYAATLAEAICLAIASALKWTP